MLSLLCLAEFSLAFLFTASRYVKSGTDFCQYSEIKAVVGADKRLQSTSVTLVTVPRDLPADAELQTYVDGIEATMAATLDKVSLQRVVLFYPYFPLF